MAKLKHNKRRNTAFLFEALVKELTKATLEKDNETKDKLVKILKESFSKGTLLAKELDLFKTISETHSVGKAEAEKILAEVKRVYSNFDQGSIFAAQSQVINKVNKTVGQQVFSNFVPNYKAIATIAQIFNNKVPIKSRVLLETQILNRMVSVVIEEKKPDGNIKNSTVRLFAKRFNDTYGELFKEQKDLLGKFISSFQDNGLELKTYLNDEISRLKEEVSTAKKMEEIKEDSTMDSKMDKVLEMLNDFKGELITEKLLGRVLRIQQLVNEIKS